ncbi:Las1-like-domain-containing protein [Butyriboletus roseoflavus]|nr:Las1-like-domain-containing protein [Butyriboletus roseoflavus]
MRLPRRVPWAYVDELEQVCSWIYADEEDLEAKTLAIDRLSAWKAVTPLPHALESALAILAARMLDASCRDALSAKTALSLRQTYAAAIIRMVNGLVDPLQSGPYARSIAAIATQLGLPSWLVELRHAATHEDLPSLELFREAVRESLSWLLRNYFDPTLNPSTSTSSLSLRPITPLLRSYKLLMKTVARDESLRKQYQDEIDAVMRDIERWITETKVSAELAVNPLGWGFDDNSVAARVDIKEKWALEIICGALLERGAIVPVSKRKCRAPADPFLPTAASLALWMPLFTQLRATHPSFPSIFISRTISILLDDLMGSNLDINIIEPDSKSLPRGAIYNEYLARWVTWAARSWTDESDHGTDLKKEVILQIAPIFIPGHHSRLKAKILNELLQATSAGSKDLEESVELLRSTVAVVPLQPWQAHDLVDMEERLHILTANEFQTPELFGNVSTVRNSATRCALGHVTCHMHYKAPSSYSWAGPSHSRLRIYTSITTIRYSTLPKECQKAAKILSSFIDGRNSGLDGIIPHSILENAKGFAIFTIFKAGFLLSARAGTGIVIAKLPNGSWSAPSAIGSAGLGVGGQLGAEMTDFLVVLNSAAKSFMSAGSLTLGGNLSVAVGPLGRNGEAIGSLNSSGKVAAMYSYSKTRGLFGGVSIEGSVIVERQDANALAYNQDVTVKMLLSGAVPRPDWAEPLVKTLESCTSRPGSRSWIDDRAEGQALYAFGSTYGTSTTGPKTQRFPSFLGKKKKDSEFPPRHWGTRTDSGSYFSNDLDRHSPTRWEDIDEPSHRSPGFDDEYEPSSGSLQQTNHRTPYSVGTSTNTSHAPVDSYNPASPFNSLPPFRAVHSTLSDKAVSHSRSMSAYANPFSSTPPPEDDLEHYHDTVGSSPPRFKTQHELSKPLSPLEGVARAIALYAFNAVEAGDLSFSRGDIITITRKSDSTDDWWKGKLNGKEGIFPANFVEIV